MKREYRKWLIYVLVVIGLTFFITTFIGQRTQVNGESMYPALHNKDNLIVDKISYRFSDPRRYDIIVFPYHYKDRTYYIKRVIGLPGETIQISDGKVLINGEVYEENGNFPDISNGGLAADSVSLESGEYFVLGDNRNNSEDSRYGDIGNINRKYIVGKLWFTISPREKTGFLKG